MEGMAQVTASPENANVPEVLGLFENVTASLVTVLLVYGDTTAWSNPPVIISTSCPLTMLNLSSRRIVTHDRSTCRILWGGLHVLVEIRRLDSSNPVISRLECRAWS
jgi:hypothetical protein